MFDFYIPPENGSLTVSGGREMNIALKWVNAFEKKGSF